MQQYLEHKSTSQPILRHDLGLVHVVVYFRYITAKHRAVWWCNAAHSATCSCDPRWPRKYRTYDSESAGSSGVAGPLAAWCGGQICRPNFLGFGQVAQLSQRPRDAPVTSIRKNAMWNFWATLLGLMENVDASCVRRWKKRSRLPVGDNWTL